MAESTLSLTYDDLRARVGHFLGYGRVWSSMSEAQQDLVDDAIRSGLRKFYWPPPLPGESVGHSWTFMKPVRLLTLPSGHTEVNLPDDFSHMEGDIAWSGSSSSIGAGCRVVGEGFIRQKRSENSSVTGRPLFAAVRSRRGVTATEGQRFELSLWPTPDQEYTASICYCVLPQALTSGKPNPLGGAVHAETILEACLASAEAHGDDTQSVHASLFMERLMASVAQDRRLAPSVLGYNADRSVSNSGRSHSSGTYVVTYNGQEV